MVDFDTLLEQIGPFDRYQILFCIVLGIAAAVPAGVQTLIGVYIYASPAHWCHVPELANLSLTEQLRLTVPSSELIGDNKDESCRILDLNYTDVAINYVDNSSYASLNHSTTRECTSWVYDMDLYGTTAVTRWDLVCDKAPLRSLATSLYMLGFLIGVTVFGYVSDRIGRRKTWMVCMTLGAAISVASSFMPEFWSLVFTRMCVAICLAGSYTVCFVLMMEMVGKEKRVIAGMAFNVWFTIGYMSLPMFAYLIKNYIWLNFTVSILSTVFIGTYWIVPESARWLLTAGRVEEAKREIRRMGKFNRSPETDTLLAFETFLVEEAKKDSAPDKTYTMLDMVRTPRMRSRTFTITLTWLVSSMGFYGISLAVADLAGNPYINMVVSGVTECVGMAVAIIALNKLGRRLPLCAMMVFGGAACLLINFIPDKWRIVGTVLAMLGKFGISGAFALVYVFTAELFPTVVRTIAVGTGSMGARVGGLLAPLVNELSFVWGPLPMFIFGGGAVAVGLLSLLLPETLHHKLPETLEEGENFGRNNKQKCFSRPKKCQEAII